MRISMQRPQRTKLLSRCRLKRRRSHTFRRRAHSHGRVLRFRARATCCHSGSTWSLASNSKSKKSTSWLQISCLRCKSCNMGSEVLQRWTWISFRTNSCEWSLKQRMDLSGRLRQRSASTNLMIEGRNSASSPHSSKFSQFKEKLRNRLQFT